MASRYLQEDGRFDLVAMRVHNHERDLGDRRQMLKNTDHLKGFSLHAKDGELGKVDEFYFDDVTWAVRYLTVDTGGWLSGRKVLISPISVLHADWQLRRLDLNLTKEQIENSPDISTHQPVSRQLEAEYYAYYGYPSYWEGPFLWGPGFYPGSLLGGGALPPEAMGAKTPTSNADSHLRSSAEVIGYDIEAADGEMGHVAGFLIDDEDWSIRYIEVATRNWLPGKKVLFSPEWIQRIDWQERAVVTTLSREAIQSAPEYGPSEPVTREYEDQLFRHYGRSPYWISGAEKHAVPR